MPPKKTYHRAETDLSHAMTRPRSFEQNFRVTFAELAVCFRYQSWVDYITAMFEYEFPTRTTVRRSNGAR